MSMVVLDNDSIENIIVKQKGVNIDGQNVGCSFLSAKNINQRLNVLGVQSIFMGLVGAAVTKNILNEQRWGILLEL